MLDKINIDFLSVYFLRFFSLSLAGCCPFVCAQMFAFVWPSRCNAEKGKGRKKRRRENTTATAAAAATAAGKKQNNSK